MTWSWTSDRLISAINDRNFQCWLENELYKYDNKYVMINDNKHFNLHFKLNKSLDDASILKDWVDCNVKVSFSLEPPFAICTS